MKLICSLKDNTEATVCRVLSASGEIALGESFCGMMLSELSPYAFSDTDRGLPARSALVLLDPDRTAPLLAAGLSDEAWNALLSGAVTGTRLLSLSLPRSIKKIGRYAFYNCSSLHTLSMYSTTIDLGQGLFTGCSAVRRINAVVNEEKRSSLYELLSEFRYPLLLSYYKEAETSSMPGTDIKEPLKTAAGEARDDFHKDALKYRLVFPEFYENSDENTPARITVRDLHGSGLMYRNCFANTQFQIQRYDALFPYAEALEPEKICAELALCRLMVPEGLHEDARTKYASWLSAHTAAMADVLARQHAEGLISLSDVRELLTIPAHTFDRPVRTALLDRLTAAGSLSLVPLLMDLLRTEPSQKRKRHFEL